jgi:hypothetical protein
MHFNITSAMRGIFPALAAIAFLGCSQDDEDAQGGQLNTTIELASTAALQGRLIITSAVMNIERLDVSAVSLSKNTVKATTEFSGEDQSFVLMGRSLSTAVPMETRSDRYNPLTIRITTTSSDYSPIIHEENGVRTLDYNDFQINAKPALLVTGNYERRGVSIPVILSIPQINPLITTATQNGDPSVEVGLENLAEITMNPGIWFEEITTQMLDDATTVLVDNREIIFIDPTTNSNIFTKILLEIESPEKSMSFNLTVTKRQEKS